MTEEENILKVVEKRGLSASELERILSFTENQAPKQVVAFEDYFEKKITIGVFSDCHIGHLEFDEPLFRNMVKQFKQHRVSRVYQIGDMLEGMSGRDGQIYELSELGFSRQIEKAEEMLLLLKDVDVFGINGNHDDWYLKKKNIGVDVGLELQKRLPNYHHLGTMEANVDIGKDISMKLFHPNDGTAYAESYKLQKLIQSFTGGEKPNVLLEGHYHKALYLFDRNIHALECGTICGQTGWMRGKKIPAKKGYWIINMRMGRGGIGDFNPHFFPGYK